MAIEEHKYSKQREAGECQYHVLFTGQGFTAEFVVWASDENEARMYGKELLVADIKTTVTPWGEPNADGN